MSPKSYSPQLPGSKHSIQWLRADPAELAAFDPKSKFCDLNCGRHMDDPRSDRERLYLCDLCGDPGKEQSNAS